VTDAALIRRHVVVRGVVQGVGFRYSAWRAAHAHGVTGWIRNLPDGTVEAVFEGETRAVRAVLGWCEHGPRGARVESVDVSEEEPEGCNGFEIR
jgi:acylphosphatase